VPPWTAESALREKLAVRNTRPLLAPLLEKDALKRFIRIYWDDDRRKRDAFRDLGDMLLQGEAVAKPLHPSPIHAGHVQVLTLAIGDLLHPRKMYSPRSASKEYNDLARRRLLAWYWAATFQELRLSDAQMVEEAKGLAAWARNPSSEAPALIATLVTDVVGPLDAITYSRRTWRYWAVLALLASRDPRDPLTGQLLSLERGAGREIQDDHVFPRRWSNWADSVPLAKRNSIVNIVPITQYTNGWKSNKGPNTYVSEILALGVSRQRLKSLLDGHLIDLDLLVKEDWDRFYADRHARMTQFLADRFYEIVEGTKAARVVPDRPIV
jgi:hypothetical protein